MVISIPDFRGREPYPKGALVWKIYSAPCQLIWSVRIELARALTRIGYSFAHDMKKAPPEGRFRESFWKVTILLMRSAQRGSVRRPRGYGVCLAAELLPLLSAFAQVSCTGLRRSFFQSLCL